MDDSELERLLARSLPPGSEAADIDPGASLRPARDDTLRVRAPEAAEDVADAPAPGRSYDLLDRLGAGGMGIVHRAVQPGLEREVAVKRIRPDLAEDPDSRRAFVAEARVTGALDHPNVVPVHELARDGDGELLLSMKLVDGVPWSRLLHPRTAEERDEAAGHDLGRHLDILLAVANAVAYAHSKQIIHRDLKPDNVMVGRFGEVLVMDWGLAVSVADEDGASRPPHKSSANLVSGTPSYMAPEMAEGRGGDLGPWTDIYLLGAILYEIVTRERPHRGDSVVEVIAAASRAEEPRFPAGVPDELARICRRAMAREPRNRQRSVAELQSDLRAFLRHRESLAITKAAAERLARTDEARAHDDPRLHADLADAIAGFRQARVLWEGNDEARRGEQAARLRQADSALEAGDFALVEATLEGLEDDGVAERVARARAGLDARRRTEARVRVLRRGLVAATVILITGLLAGLLVIGAERDRADESAARYRASLVEIGELSDVARLARLEDEAERLWPAVPERETALLDWLGRAREIAAARERHERTLEDLRRRALPYTGADRARDFADRAAVIARDEDWADRLADAAEDTEDDDIARRIESYRLALEPVIERSRQIFSKLRRWHFEDPVDQWRHDVLEELVARLARFAGPDGTLSGVEERLAFARELAGRVEEDRARWEAAAAAVAADDRFKGLKLVPQTGLVPLGADPKSGLQEFLHLATHRGDVPRRDAGGALQLAPETGAVLVLLPPAAPIMGAQAADPEAPHYDEAATKWESPVHRVVLDAFFIGRHEVSQAQWERVTGGNPSKYRPGFGREGLPTVTAAHPVEQVSWEECDDVLRRVGLELPTEAQWEYAARAGTATPWWTGSEAETLVSAANLGDRAAGRTGASWGLGEEAQSRDDGYHVHAPVDGLRPNAFGLHHVHGNVWEWCREWFDSYLIPVDDGDGERIVFRGKGRVMRGGSYSGSAGEARASNRYDMDPTVRVATIGVRAARRLER